MSVDATSWRDNWPEAIRIEGDVDAACDRFEASWRAGDRPLIEAFLGGSTDSRRPALLRHLLAVELDYRGGLGESPESSEYRIRFPGHDGLIDSVFAGFARRFKVDGRSDSGTIEFSSGWDRTSSGGATCPPPDPFPNIAGCEILSELGRGGMGVVYKVRQIRLNRLCAVKIALHGKHTGAESRVRFLAEAETIARLKHPNLVQIHSLGEHDGRPYFEMEYIEGGSLARRLDGTPWASGPAARMVAVLARAIGDVHRLGIVHRDLKPANVLLTDDETPKIVDFGLAKTLEADTNLTQSGVFVGTPSYAAPEQVEGLTKTVGPAADIYALGAIFYHLLTGRPPFQAATVLQTLEQVKSADPVPPSRLQPGLPRDVETIVLKCLEKDPWRRYASADALADDLRRWLDGEPIAARPVGVATRGWMWARRNLIVTGLLAALVLLALGTTWQWWRAESLLLQARRDASSEGIDHALSICAQGDVGRGMLRLAEALETAPADLKPAIRANLVAWSWHQTQLTNLLRHSDLVHFVAFSPDGRTAVTASPDGTARLWDALTGEPRGAPLRHEGGVFQAAFSPDSRHVITASLDRTARLWEVDGGRPWGAPLRHRGPVRSVAFSPDGRTVLTGSNDGAARIWDVASQQPRGEPLPHEGWVQQVGFRPDGNVAITAAQGDNTVRLWDLRDGRAICPPIPYYPGRRHNRTAGFFATSADGESILTTGSWRSGQQECAQFWDATRGQPLGRPLCHHGGIRAVAWSGAGNVAITGSDDRTARLWDARTGKPLGGPLRHQGQVLVVALNDAGTLALTGSEDRTARLWKVPGGEPVGDPLHHPGQVLAVAFRPDGRAVLTGCDDGVGRLWTLAPAGPAGTPVPDADLKVLSHLARSPDGRMILMGHTDGTAQVRDAATMQPLGPPLRHEYAILSVAISPDSSRLLTGCVDGTVHIWSARTRRPIGRPLLHQGPVHSVAFSPDGRMVLTGSGDRTARLWDAATGKPIGMPWAHAAGVVAVAFSAAGDAVLTKTEHGIVRRWERAADASGPDERFVLSAQLAIEAEIGANGSVRAFGSSTWDRKWNRLRALGGMPAAMNTWQSGRSRDRGVSTCEGPEDVP
jgi:WD40 repeat protein/tRNA A-37 threonylcarbamoyl transferase component Bud32